MPNVLQRFGSEDRIPSFFRKGHVLQADRSLFKVDRIHTELSIVQFNDGIDWQIFLSAEILCLRMGSIFLLAGQIDALPLLPKLHCGKPDTSTLPSAVSFSNSLLPRSSETRFASSP